MPAPLRLLFRFDVDEHLGTLNRLDQGNLQPVAYLMGRCDGHAAGHHQVELDEGRAAGGSRLHIVGFDCARGIVGNHLADLAGDLAR